ncbi:unnamed protein product [Adineta ricciae]|uniref:G-protein coupled receptors family 1 profile domain-containing protein n=1 Tax=Adineta ricciae TaxID=249248 RepID=A0A815G619_ADIRI|nr:unnamed protein product [Adineta ricciae]CAF1334503.1 unnamed protein product [Adineta ricciae]
MSVPYPVCFWLYLIFLIPSVLCSLFCLYHFLVDRILRNALHNHFIILILAFGTFLNLTDLIWFIDFYRTGHVSVFTRVFCFTWTYIDYAVYVVITLLVAWGAIERHILVFHHNLLRTRKARFFLHYLPIFMVTIYPFVYYIIIYFILPCEPILDYTQIDCGVATCAGNIGALSVWDSLAHNVVPICMIAIFSLALLARVWYSKYRVSQRMQWKNYRKMTIQLVSITGIYLIIVFPSMVLYTMDTVGVLDPSAYDFYNISYYCSYFTTLLNPFVCVIALPELRSKLQRVFQVCSLRRCVRSNRVSPIDHRTVAIVNTAE